MQPFSAILIATHCHASNHYSAPIGIYGILHTVLVVGAPNGRWTILAGGFEPSSICFSANLLIPATGSPVRHGMLLQVTAAPNLCSCQVRFQPPSTPLTRPHSTISSCSLALRLGPLLPHSSKFGGNGRLQHHAVHEILKAGAGLCGRYARARLHGPQAAAQHVLVAVHLQASTEAWEEGRVGAFCRVAGEPQMPCLKFSPAAA